MADSSFDTLSTTSTTEDGDKYLTYQGRTDGSVTRALLFDTMYPVGSLVLHTDLSVSPSDRGFEGTWEPLEDDYALSVVATDADLGLYVGSNTITVGVPSHTHTASINTAGGHVHNYSYLDVAAPRDWANNPEEYDNRVTSVGAISPSRAGNHAHNVTLGYAGTTSPTVQVQGRRVPYIVWERIE